MFLKFIQNDYFFLLNIFLKVPVGKGVVWVKVKV